MINHLERLMQCNSIEEIWTLHLARMADFGFDRLLYAFTRFRTPNSFGNIDDVLILSNHSEAYLDGYIKGGLYRHAPMACWAAENVGARSWSLVSERREAGLLTPQEQRSEAFNRQHGIAAGYVISFRDLSFRSKGAISLVARPGMSQAEVDELWEARGREILIINNITHLRITALPFTTRRRNLSPRQREVLEWVGNGKTTAEIAQIMGLTPGTIEKHLRLARETLGVDTTAQAVLKALYHNQIFLLET